MFRRAISIVRLLVMASVALWLVFAALAKAGDPESARRAILSHGLLTGPAVGRAVAAAVVVEFAVLGVCTAARGVGCDVGGQHATISAG